MSGELSAELREALDRAPDDERVLLELQLSWTNLDEAAARIAARLRVFLVTWDPLEWHDPRPARATATGDGDGFEVVLYVALDKLLSDAREAGTGIADVLGGYAGSVLAVGVRYELALVAGAYAQLAFDGAAPGLLLAVGDEPGRERPTLALRSPDWEPIGLGAIQDVVQEAFGPVDLDRAPDGWRPSTSRTPAVPPAAGRASASPPRSPMPSPRCAASPGLRRRP